MIYVVVYALAAINVALIIATYGVMRAMVRQHARERERLVNQVCHLSGRPWQEAPANEPNAPAAKIRLIAAPEQLPDL